MKDATYKALPTKLQTAVDTLLVCGIYLEDIHADNNSNLYVGAPHQKVQVVKQTGSSRRLEAAAIRYLSTYPNRDWYKEMMALDN